MKPSEILKAHEDGLVVEWKSTDSDSWIKLNVNHSTSLRSLSYPYTEYRIKKEPRTFWLTLRNNGSLISNNYEVNSESAARKLAAELNSKRSCARYQPYTVIKVTEDL